MISPSDWVKQLGVGGQLAPFFKCVCVYFVVLGVCGESAPSAAAAACKCAPVLCLLAALVCRALTRTQHKRRYAALVCVGLALSAVGDALLVWPARLVAGMGAFGGAHVAYILAFGWEPLCARVAPPLVAGVVAFLALLQPAGVLRVLVPLYGALLTAMAWRGAARGGAAAAGAALFLLSDGVLAYSLFAGPVPHKQVIVMSTYYMAQLGITYSALREEPGRAGTAGQPPSGAHHTE